MTAILLLAGTDKPENRTDDALATQLVDADTVAARIVRDCDATVTLCLPNRPDAKTIDADAHPCLVKIPCVDDTVDLSEFDAVVAIPPHEASGGPLSPFAARVLSYFMENEKRFAVCNRTCGALRWLLPPDIVGLYKSECISDDLNLTKFLNE